MKVSESAVQDLNSFFLGDFFEKKCEQMQHGKTCDFRMSIHMRCWGHNWDSI